MQEEVFHKKKEINSLNERLTEDKNRLLSLQMNMDLLVKQTQVYSQTKEKLLDEIQQQQRQLQFFYEDIQLLRNNYPNNTLNEKIVLTEVTQDCIQVCYLNCLCVIELIYLHILDVNQNVLFTLGQLTIEFPEIHDYVMLRLQENELKIPMNPSSSMNLLIPSKSITNIENQSHKENKVIRPISSNSNNMKKTINSTIIKPKTFELEI